jgi:hypothetical protein
MGIAFFITPDILTYTQTAHNFQNNYMRITYILRYNLSIL